MKNEMKNLKNEKKGFTLIELLIVIAIIAILAGIVFIALNPLRRFQDARDAKRFADITAVVSSTQLDQVDNGGSYLTSITDATANEVYMIVNGPTMVLGCDDNNLICDTNVTTDTHCLDLSGFVTEGYLGELPVAPSSGAVTWDDGSGVGNEGTGYTIEKKGTGALFVRSCESENSSEIKVVR